MALEGIHPVHRQTPQKLVLDFQKDGYIRWKSLYLRTDLGDFKIRILSLDALIEAKKAIGRARDIHAVHELEAIRELRKKQSW